MYFRFVLTTNNNNIEFILFLCSMDGIFIAKLTVRHSFAIHPTTYVPSVARSAEMEAKFNKGAKDNFESSQQDFFNEKRQRFYRYSHLRTNFIEQQWNIS